MHSLRNRPAPKDGEWWDSYVARVMDENGYPPTHIALFQRFEGLVVPIVSAQRQQLMRAGTVVSEGLREFAGMGLPQSTVLPPLSPVRYCPQCLSERHYAEIVGRLRVVTHCGVHRRLLRSQCSSCQRPVRRADLARTVCRCGVRFAQSTDVEADSRMSDDLLSHGLESGGEARSLLISTQQATACLSASEKRPQQGLRVARLVMIGMLFLRLAKVTERFDESSSSTLSRLFTEMTALGSAGSDRWFSALWESLPSQLCMNQALSLVLWLRRREATSQSELGGLPFLAWAQELCDAGASALRVERSGWIESGVLSKRFIRARHAAKLLGVQPSTLQRFIREGVVQAAVRHKGRIPSWSVSIDQLPQLGHLLRHTGGRELVKGIGVETGCLRPLRESGIVEASTDRSGRRWIDAAAVEQVLCSLRRVACSQDSLPSARVSLGSRYFWEQASLWGGRRLYDLMLSGRLRIWMSSAGIGFARFWVGLDEFLTVRTEQLAFLSATGCLVSQLPLLAAEGDGRGAAESQCRVIEPAPIARTTRRELPRVVSVQMPLLPA